MGMLTVRKKTTTQHTEDKTHGIEDIQIKIGDKKKEGRMEG